jgi:hypothetical protein
VPEKIWVALSPTAKPAELLFASELKGEAFGTKAYGRLSLTDCATESTTLSGALILAIFDCPPLTPTFAQAFASVFAVGAEIGAARDGLEVKVRYRAPIWGRSWNP